MSGHFPRILWLFFSPFSPSAPSSRHHLPGRCMQSMELGVDVVGFYLWCYVTGFSPIKNRDISIKIYFNQERALARPGPIPAHWRPPVVKLSDFFEWRKCWRPLKMIFWSFIKITLKKGQTQNYKYSVSSKYHYQVPRWTLNMAVSHQIRSYGFQGDIIHVLFLIRVLNYHKKEITRVLFVLDIFVILDL